MEDSLMRVFGGDRIKSLMGTFGIPEDQPIQNGMISKQLEAAQTRIEGFHFDSRKQVLAYDDVLNQQRTIVYERRKKLLLDSNGEVDSVLEEVKAAIPEVEGSIEKKKQEFGGEWHELMRKLALQMIDILWVEHLEVMQAARSSVNLRAYGQRDPLIEYRREGMRLFNEMQDAVLHRIAEVIPKLEPQALQREEEELTKARAHAQQAGGDSEAQKAARAPRVNTDAHGRNDLVTITDGTETQQLKYKKAEELIATGKWRISA
jgi:preprotein translocase subunit SecA